MASKVNYDFDFGAELANPAKDEGTPAGVDYDFDFAAEVNASTPLADKLPGVLKGNTMARGVATAFESMVGLGADVEEVGAGQYAKDTGSTFMAGSARTVETLGYLTQRWGDKVPFVETMLGASEQLAAMYEGREARTGKQMIEQFGAQMREVGKDSSDFWLDKISDEYESKMQAGLGDDEFGVTTIIAGAAQSLNEMMLTAGAGAGAGKLAALASKVGIKPVAAAAANGSVLAKRVMKYAGYVPAAAGAVGAGLTEGAMAGGASGVAVEEEILAMGHEELVSGSDRYFQIYAAAEGMPEGDRRDYAKMTLAEEAGRETAVMVGLSTAALGAPMGAVFGHLGGAGARRLGAKSLPAKLESSIGRQAAVGAVGEFAQEFMQEGAQQALENLGIRNYADHTQEIGEGVIESAILGGLIGGLMGGGITPALGGPARAQAKGELARAKQRKELGLPEHAEDLRDGDKPPSTAIKPAGESRNPKLEARITEQLNQLGEAGVPRTEFQKVARWAGRAGFTNPNGGRSALEFSKALETLIETGQAPENVAAEVGEHFTPNGLLTQSAYEADKVDFDFAAELRIKPTAEQVPPLMRALAQEGATPYVLDDGTLVVPAGMSGVDGLQAVGQAVQRHTGIPVDFVRTEHANSDTTQGEDSPGEVAPEVPDAQGAEAAPGVAPSAAATATAAIDRRLEGLREAEATALAPERLRELQQEAADLEALVREQDALGDVRGTPDTRLTPEERAIADTRRAEVRAEIEAHRTAVSAGRQREQLEGRLAKIDADEDLIALGQSLDAPRAQRSDGTVVVTPEDADGIDAAVQRAATHPDSAYREPTEAQMRAGNYAKGKVLLKGTTPGSDLRVSVESVAGSIRRSMPGQPKWSRKMKHHYGYFPGTKASDGDPVDVYLGRGAHDPSLPAFVIRQMDPETGAYDEPKVVLGYASEGEAKAAYLSEYPRNLHEGLFGGITRLDRDQLSGWLKSGETDVPPHPMNKQPMRELRAPRGTEGVRASLAQPAPPTDTPAFRNWFGDSKVVDANGEPLVVYHSTTFGNFDTFDKAQQHKGMAGYGFYFSDSDGANIYAEYGMNFQTERDWQGNPKAVNIMPTYLRMENPLRADNIADVFKRFGRADPGNFGQGRKYGGMGDEVKTAIQRAGYDGVIATEHVKRMRDGSYEVVEPGSKGAIAHPVYVVFEPNQIKSATGNRGTFDPASPDIRMSLMRRREDTDAFDAPVESAPTTSLRLSIARTAQGLQGLPARVEVDGVRRTFGPFKAAHDAARAYMRSAGRPYNPTHRYVAADVKRGRRIAAAYQQMVHAPQDPMVQRAYQALIEETMAQWEAMKATGLQVEFNPPGTDPYGNPRNAILDIVENNHLYVFPTDEGFGSSDLDVSDNPLLGDSGEKWGGKPVLFNDIFRAVHDYFGHAMHGVGFRASGEENAWRSHAAMYSPLARWAMTSETRGQNSWVNFGPHADHNKNASGADTIYADQKVGLLPLWVVEEGRTDAMRELPKPSPRRREPRTIFEVAPHPSDAQAEGWNAMPLERRITASRAVVEAVVPALREAGVPVTEVGNSLGGYGPDVNASHSIELSPMTDRNARLTAAAAVGHALGQESVVLLEGSGESEVGAVTIDFRDGLTPERAQAVYTALRNRIGPEIAGFTAVGDTMEVLNFSLVDTEVLAELAAHALHDYDGVTVYAERLSATFIEEKDYGRHLRGLSDAGRAAADRARQVHRQAVQAQIDLAQADPGAGAEAAPRLSLADPTRTAAFRRWFGDSKVVDANGDPLVVYHGTRGSFNAFEMNRPARRAVMFDEREVESQGAFFSEDEADARSYGRNVMPVYLSVQNPFTDPADVAVSSRDPASAQRAQRAWEDAEYILQPLIYEDAQGRRLIDYNNGISATEVDPDGEWVGKLFTDGRIDWDVLDNPDVVARLKERGYDGARVNEPNDDSGTSWFVVRPEQIKSATGNTGAFDPARADIRLSKNAKAHNVSELPARFEILPGLYSALYETLQTSRGVPKAATAAQWKGWLDGAQRRGDFRAEEREWTELDELLANPAHYGVDPEAKIPLRALLEQVTESYPTIEETVLDGDVDSDIEQEARDLIREPAFEEFSEGRESAYFPTSKEGIIYRIDGETFTDYEDAVHHLEQIEGEDTDTSQIEEVTVYYPAVSEYHHGVEQVSDDYYEDEYEAEEAAQEEAWERDSEAEVEEFEDWFNRLDGDELREIADRHGVELPGDGSAQYGDWTAPGGSNYREVLFHDHDNGYEAPHFDGHDSGLIGHLRVKDRTIVEDGRALRAYAIEEVQSDLHQAGLESGYADSTGRAERTAREARRAEQLDRFEAELAELMGTEPGQINIAAVSSEMASRMTGAYVGSSARDTVVRALRERHAEMHDLMARYREWASNENYGHPIDPAPFKRSWREVFVKHALRDAAINGYDALVWTTGIQQADRYRGGVSRVADIIEWVAEEPATPAPPPRIEVRPGTVQPDPRNTYAIVDGDNGPVYQMMPARAGLSVQAPVALGPAPAELADVSAARSARMLVESALDRYPYAAGRKLVEEGEDGVRRFNRELAAEAIANHPMGMDAEHQARLVDIVAQGIENESRLAEAIKALPPVPVFEVVLHGQTGMSELAVYPTEAEALARAAIEEAKLLATPPRVKAIGKVIGHRKNGERSFEYNIDENYQTVELVNGARQNLKDLIGGDLFAEIQKAPHEDNQFDSTRVVGGRGQVLQYDQMMPKLVQKLVKPFGLKVERTSNAGFGPSTPGGQDAWRVDITPELREFLTGGVPAYSVAGAKAAQESDARTREVREAVEDVGRNLKGAPPYTVVASDAGLPGHILQQIKSIGAEGQVEGLYDQVNRRVYIIANGIVPRGEESVREAAERVFAEEVLGHYGLRATFGPKAMNALFDQVWRDLHNHPRMVAIVEQYAPVYGDPYRDREVARAMADEFLAKADPNAEPSLWAKAVAWLRDQLRKMGFVRQWSDNDLKAMMSRVFDGVRTGVVPHSLAKLERALVQVADDGTTTATVGDGKATRTVAYKPDRREITLPGAEAGVYEATFDNLPAAELSGFRGKPAGFRQLARYLAEEGKARLVAPRAFVPDAFAKATGLAYRDEGVARVFTLPAAAPGKSSSFSLRNRQRGTEDQERVLNKAVAPATTELSIGQKIQKTLRELTGYFGDSDTWLELRTGWIDSAAAIEKLERDQFDGNLLDAADSAYKMVNLTRNLPQIVGAVAKYGVPTFRDGTFVREPGRRGLYEIFAPLVKTDDGKNLLYLWEGYAVARRSSQLINERNPDGTSKEKLLDAGEIATLLSLEEAYPVFRKVFDEWQQFNHELLDLAVERGAMSAETAALWKSNDYVPFYRVEEEEDVAGGMTRKRGLSGQKVTSKRLTGSDRRIQPVMDNIMLNTAGVLEKVYKNEAMNRIVALADGVAMEKVPMRMEPVELSNADIVRQLRKAGIEVADELTPEQRAQWSTFFRPARPEGRDIVSAMVAGKPVYYKVNDPLLLRAITDMTPVNFGGLVNLMGGAKHVLTNMVTLDPGFMLANWMRDSLSAWVTVDEGLNPATALTSAADIWREEGLVADLAMAGGSVGGFYNVTQDFGDVLRRMKGSGATVLETPRQLYDAYRKIGMVSEQVNRVGVARQVLARGGSLAEAAYQAQDVLNFSQHGDAVAAQLLIRTVPFLNARIQGLDRLQRGARGLTSEDPATARKRFLMKALWLAGASMMLALKNLDDERYERLPQDQKDGYWHLFFGDYHFALPKPFEVGVLAATVPERVMRRLKGADSTGTLVGSMGRAMGETFAFNPIPQLFKPVVEQWANRTFYGGRPIVGLGMDGLEPQAQYNPWTSETARAVADGMDQVLPDSPIFDAARSPARIEHLARAYFGSVGGYLMSLSDAALRASGAYPEAPEWRDLRDAPGLGGAVARFYRGSDPELGNTRYQDDLYDALGTADAAYRTLNAYVRQGEIERAEKLLGRRVNELSVRETLHAFRTQASEINAAQRQVMNSDLSPAEKRKMLDELGRAKNRLMAQSVPYLGLVE